MVMKRIFKLLPALRLWEHISTKHKVGLLLLVIIMLFAGLGEFISIGLLIPFVGFIINPDAVFALEILQPFIKFFNLARPEQLLMPITILLILSAVVSSGIRILLLWVSTRLGQAIAVDISAQVFLKTLCQPYETHVNRHSSEIISGITNKSKAIVNSNIAPLLNILSSCFMIIGIFCILIFVNPLITSILFSLFGSIYFFISVITRKLMTRSGIIASNQSNQVVRFLQEGLGNIRDVLISGTQEIYSDLFNTSNQKLSRATGNIVITGGLPRFLIEGIAIILIAIGAYVYIGISNEPADIVPVSAAIVIAAQRLLPLLQLIFASITSLRGGHAALNDILELINQELPIYLKANNKKNLNFNNNIVFKNVSFSYKNTSSLAIKDINLNISKGSTIGFMGETGSGKSTIVDLLMGLLSPIKGMILIDGESINPSNVNLWQSKISHVPQSIFINDASIASNIAFGVPVNQIDMQRVEYVSKIAQISESIQHLPNQYSTIVGEMGAKLSGGQRQRIAIARALYREFDVLVFDEATSALDNETEHNLMEAINELSPKPTIIMIAHRLSTLKNCDLIYELDKGVISRSGTYDKIINLKLT